MFHHGCSQPQLKNLIGLVDPKLASRGRAAPLQRGRALPVTSSILLWTDQPARQRGRRSLAWRWFHLGESRQPAPDLANSVSATCGSYRPCMAMYTYY